MINEVIAKYLFKLGEKFVELNCRAKLAEQQLFYEVNCNYADNVLLMNINNSIIIIIK